MARNIIPYKPALKEIARGLRNHSTLGEVLLWKKLRNKQMLGYDFHRQKPLDQFIVDFYCHELNLAIEIDGAHTNRRKHWKKMPHGRTFGISRCKVFEIQRIRC